MNKKIIWIVLVAGIVALGVYVVSRVSTPAPQKVFTVGIARWVDNPHQDQNIEAFKKGLALGGYKEGENVRFLEPASAIGDKALHKLTMENLVKENPDLIYSPTTIGTMIVKGLTTTIPIVFSIVIYPVEVGMIKSLQNSGNNLVGARNWVPAEDQIALIKELVPTMTSLGFVHRKDEPNSTFQLAEFTKILTPMGIKVVPIQPALLAEILPAMKKVRGQIDSLYGSCDSLVQGQQGEDIIIAYAKEERLPDFACVSSGVRKGGLAGMVADYEVQGQLAGEKAALILDGASPSSLETNTVARPFIYINQKTADALGITISQSLISRAHEIIK